MLGGFFFSGWVVTEQVELILGWLGGLFLLLGWLAGFLGGFLLLATLLGVSTAGTPEGSGWLSEENQGPPPSIEIWCLGVAWDELGLVNLVQELSVWSAWGVASAEVLVALEELLNVLDSFVVLYGECGH